MITLADYEEDFHNNPEDGPSLDDSNITEDITGIDEVKYLLRSRSTYQISCLRKKITEMEIENEELKVQLKTYKYAGIAGMLFY